MCKPSEGGDFDLTQNLTLQENRGAYPINNLTA